MARLAARVYERRRLVAQLLVRGYSTRQIADALKRQGWKASQPTVVRDEQVITAEWKRLSVAALGEHKARQLAELMEVCRVAWSSTPPDLATILRAKEIEIKLLGTAGYQAPVEDVEAQLVEMGLDPAHVLRQVEDLLAGDASN